MKRIIALAVAFGLAGCASTPSSLPTQGGIKDIQNAAVQICRFVPTAQTVANILLSSNMTVATVLGIATSICNAVTINPLADGPGAKNYRPHVNGVPVRGTFIK